jgi:hypothetical protein
MSNGQTASEATGSSCHALPYQKTEDMRKKVADVHDDTTDTGKIGFQVHPGDEFKNMKIIVRSIAILEW